MGSSQVAQHYSSPQTSPQIDYKTIKGSFRGKFFIKKGGKERKNIREYLK